MSDRRQTFAALRERLQKPGSMVLLVCLVSLAARMVFAYFVRDSFFTRGNSFGPLNSIAFNLISCGSFAITPEVPSLDYEPVYPCALAMAYKGFGHGWFGVALIQSLLFFASSLVLYRIISELTAPWCGALLATYYSFYPFLFLQAISVVDTTVFLFIELLLVLTFIFRQRFMNPTIFCAVLGTLTGLALLTRGSAVAILPAFVLASSWSGRLRDSVLRLTVILATALVVLSPWLVRNYRLCGSPVVSLHGPFGLWQGNNEKTWDLMLRDITLDEVYSSNPPALYTRYPLAARMPREALFVAQRYQETAVAFIKANPFRFARLALLKAYKLWTPIYNPCQAELASYGSAKLRRLVHFTAYLPLLSLAPWGLICLWKRDRQTCLLLLGILITYTGAHMIAMGYSRLRLPLDPLLMILAAAAIFHLRARLPQNWNLAVCHPLAAATAGWSLALGARPCESKGKAGAVGSSGKTICKEQN